MSITIQNESGRDGECKGDKLIHRFNDVFND